MLEFFQSFFDLSQFILKGYYDLFNPELTGLPIASSSLICPAYYSMLIGVCMGMVLVGTLPKVVTLPYSAQPETPNDQLKAEILERKRADEALKKANEQLEIKVEERTALLQAINEELHREIKERVAAEEALFVDLSERVRAEQALRESKEQLQAIIDNSSAAIYLIDPQNRYLLSNRGYQNLLSQTNEQLKGKSLYEVWSYELADTFAETNRKVLESRTPIKLEEVVPQDNGLHTYITVKFPLYDANGIPYAVCGISTDITSCKQVEEALRESEAQYRCLIETAAEGIWILDAECKTTFVNAKIAQMLGYSVEEMMEMSVFAFLDAQGQAIASEHLERRRQGIAEQYDLQFRRKDGSLLWTLVSSNPIFDNAGQYVGTLKMLTDITERKATEAALLSISKAVESSSDAIRDQTGQIIGLVGIHTDITQRKQAEEALRRSEAQLRQKASELEQALQELQQAEAKLIQSEKMSSLGQLVAGVAHEINNPLSFIHGNLDYLHLYAQDLIKLVQLYQKHYPNPAEGIQAAIEEIGLDFIEEDLPKLVSSMKVGADRILTIVLSLRNFSRTEQAEKKRVDIHEGLDNTLLILAHRLKAKANQPAIQVIKEYSHLPLVQCYPGQLNQAFINILNNAIDALEELLAQRRSSYEDLAQVGRLNVESSERSFNFQPAHLQPITPIIRIHTDVIEGNQVLIRIVDNGLGMTEEVKRRIFDPFFTTKPVGQGTGLGLSTSYQIVVEKHGGQLQCISALGKGSDFLIFIPI